MFVPDKTRDRFRKTVPVLVLLILGLIVAHSVYSPKMRKWPPMPKEPAHIPFKIDPTWEPEHDLVAESELGMVASDVKLCSQLGANILKMGGNAADAAITTCLCIGTVDTMYSSGIGGGAFITAKKFDEDAAISIDAREMAPAKAHRDMFVGQPLASKVGGLSVAIPGELMGLWKLYQIQGSGNLSWEQLVMPVAEIAKNGWHIDIRLEFALSIMNETFAFFNDDWKFLYNEDGSMPKAGDLMKRESLGKTLENIAKLGVDAFYDPKGFIARSLSSKAKEWGGILKAEDFAKYEAVIQEAIRIDDFTVNNHTVFAPNGSSSGLALGAALKIIDKFDHQNATTDFGTQETHRLIESMKWLSSIRSNLGDINVTNKNKTAIVEHQQKYHHFLSDEFVDRAFSKIKSNQTLDWREYEPAYEPNTPHGTTSLSVVDKWGNAVTLTSTVNLLFGSCLHDPETGIILNNEMDDFSTPGTRNAFGLAPSVFNYIEPFKRPLSSSAQSIVVNKDGGLELVIGAAGGSRICTAVLQAIVRTFIYGKDIVNVIANPRVHHQLIPEVATFEPPIDSKLIDMLTVMGHTSEEHQSASAMNGIRVENNKLLGQSDHWRKFGQAVGV